MADDAIVGGRVVEFGEEEGVPLAVVEGAGEQHVHPFVPAAVTGPSLVGTKAGRLERKLHTCELRGLAGDNVHHRKEGIAAVEGRTGAADDFHTLNKVHVHGKFRPQHGLFVNIVVNAVTVHQQQNAIVVVSQPLEAAHSQVAIVAVVGDVEAAHTAQDVGQSAVTVLLDLVCSDYRYRRGGFADALHVLGRAVDLNVGQVLQA